MRAWVGYDPAMTVKSSIKETSRSLLLKQNLRMTRTIGFDWLEQFFSRIKPVTTSHDLIRVGGESDGGYLIPNDLENVEICFSPGVCDTANFELELVSRGIECFLADYSVDAPPIQNALFHFEKKFLGPVENSVYMTLDSWVKKHAPTQTDFILQMDIEGAEYSVILDTSDDTLQKFRILVIEFHGLDALCDKNGFQLINLTFRKILNAFDIVHIHPTNCLKPIIYGKYEIPPVMEFTFLRKDRISSKQPTLSFPHPLDRKNVSYYEDLSLPKCWFD